MDLPVDPGRGRQDADLTDKANGLPQNGVRVLWRDGHDGLLPGSFVLGTKLDHLDVIRAGGVLGNYRAVGKHWGRGTREQSTLYIF